jgi:hypothetical protein
MHIMHTGVWGQNAKGKKAKTEETEGWSLRLPLSWSMVLFNRP